MLNTSIVAKAAALAAIVGLAAVLPLQAAANARMGTLATHASAFPTPRPQPTCGPPVNTTARGGTSRYCPV